MPHNTSAVNNFSLRIIHPVHEHSSDDLIAFKHALALAHAACGELEIIDVRNSDEPYEAFSVRGVLEKWGILPPNSERSDVGKLGLKVIKIVRKGEAKRIVRHRLQKHPHDILVIGTHERHGLDVLFGQDLAEYLADAFRQTTLYVPARARPFVNPDTGAVSLQKVLIPVAIDPPADLSFNFLHILLRVFHRDSVNVIGLHCDASKSTPSGASMGRLTRDEGDTFPAIADHLLSSFGNFLDPHGFRRTCCWRNHPHRAIHRRRSHHHDHPGPQHPAQENHGKHYRTCASRGALSGSVDSCHVKTKGAGLGARSFSFLLTLPVCQYGFETPFVNAISEASAPMTE
jgi:hypothetical protein